MYFPLLCLITGGYPVCPCEPSWYSQRTITTKSKWWCWVDLWHEFGSKKLAHMHDGIHKRTQTCWKHMGSTHAITLNLRQSRARCFRKFLYYVMRPRLSQGAVNMADPGSRRINFTSWNTAVLGVLLGHVLNYSTVCVAFGLREHILQTESSRFLHQCCTKRFARHQWWRG